MQASLLPQKQVLTFLRQLILSHYRQQHRLAMKVVVVVVLLVLGMEIAFGLALLFLIVGWLCSIRCRKKAHEAQYTSKDIPVTE